MKYLYVFKIEFDFPEETYYTSLNRERSSLNVFPGDGMRRQLGSKGKKPVSGVVQTCQSGIKLPLLCALGAVVL